MPIVSRLGWLCLLAVASAQEPVLQQPEQRQAVPTAVPVAGAIAPGSAVAAPIASPIASPGLAAPKVAAAAPTVALRADHGGEASPPAPKENAFSVPEPQTLLIVGAGLVLVALAKRRVRLSPVTVVR